MFYQELPAVGKGLMTFALYCSYPLPEDHWINQPIEPDERTFLIYSIEEEDVDVEFCRKLIAVGADANFLDPELDLVTAP